MSVDSGILVIICELFAISVLYLLLKKDRKI